MRRKKSKARNLSLLVFHFWFALEFFIRTVSFLCIYDVREKVAEMRNATADAIDTVEK